VLGHLIALATRSCRNAGDHDNCLIFGCSYGHCYGWYYNYELLRVCGSFTLIIAHGLCSSGLFCLANISSERLGSSRLLISRGI
jgi:hypothetical protein